MDGMANNDLWPPSRLTGSGGTCAPCGSTRSLSGVWLSLKALLHRGDLYDVRWPAARRGLKKTQSEPRRARSMEEEDLRRGKQWVPLIS